jgi:putative ABC transport system ATP-binding protein
LIELRNVAKSFAGPPPRAVFAGVTLSVAPCELVAILGESGSGKSTLLNIIAGLDRADSGFVSIAGREISPLDDDALTLLRRRDIGFVFQAFHVLPYLTVAQNVGLPLALLARTSAEMESRVAEMLAAVGLGDRGASMPRELSGGELQRVAIARALVHRPSIVLADEPTGNLDPSSAAGVIELLRERIRSEAACGVLVTHSHAAAALADRALTLTSAGLVDAS